MRITALSSVLAIGVVGALTHPVQADRKKPMATQELAALVAVAPALSERPERHLTTGDVATVVGDRSADIERCYVDAMGASRRGGKLDVMLTIARNGSILSVDTAAPGLPTVAAHRMHTCIRTAVDGLAFPARRSDTTAIVPYYFQRTDAPNAGPQLSCWNPRGC